MNAIEKRGIEILKQRLSELEIKCEEIDTADKYHKTFDLRVGGEYAEVKAKSKPYSKLDFISLTKNQYQALEEVSYMVYLVCGVLDDNPEIFEFSSKELQKHKARKQISYEYNKGAVLDNLPKRRL